MSKKKNGKFGSRRNKAAVRQKLVVAIAIVCVLLVGSIIALILLMKGETDKLSDDTSIPTTTLMETVTQVPAETDSLGVTTAVTEASSKPEETSTPQITQPQATQPQAAQPQATQPMATQPQTTQSQATQPSKTVVSLPYVIPGTNLMIQRVAGYDGIFLEDGSDAEVTGVAMLLLYNVGNEAVEYADVTLTYDDKVLRFEASALPAGGVVAVQEASKSTCASGDLVECTADVAVIEKLGMSEDQISVVDNGDNSLTVTNLTGTEIVTVRVFYKYFMDEEDAYVGGITYTAKISNLAANASVVVTPSHYASGASEVVMVRTYNVDA